MRRVATGIKGIPYLVTHDGRTIRYPDPTIAVHDTVVLEIKTGKIIDFIKFDTGNLAMVVGGRNMGRVGIVTHRERHAGGLQLYCGCRQLKYKTDFHKSRVVLILCSMFDGPETLNGTAHGLPLVT